VASFCPGRLDGVTRGERIYNQRGLVRFRRVGEQQEKLVRRLLWVVCLHWASLLLAAEPPADPILRIDPGMHTAAIRRIAVDARGRWLVTASEDKTARVWDLKTGKLRD